MFKKFKIQKFLDKKPPSNNSFTTMQEIKQLNKIPINVKFVKDKDDIKASFKKFIDEKKLDVPKNMIDNLIKKSAPIIMKIKKHHNRPRPKVLAKKLNIKFDDKELDSMKTPSYPSGHSAQGVLVAEVLSKMHPKHAKAFRKIGKDISDSRNIAHAHYPSDSKFGKEVGKGLFESIKDKI
tara:strand:- start:166 stop:705 length:540 start_codon:yes stop_codon:yes gene_type:complete